MTARLSTQALSSIGPAVSVPAYDREQLRSGIVHLGVGNFHRAHQALYTEKAIECAGGDWGITGVSLRSDTVPRQLQPQDCLYSVLVEDGQHTDLRIVGVLKRVLYAGEQMDEICDAIARAHTHIVTLTITEKGYCAAEDGRSLNMTDPGIAADLANAGEPRTAIGLLALGLLRRQESGAGPLTIISCDNLSENGRVLEAVLGQYVALAFPGLLDWLQHNTRFPCSMVDRIVPATEAGQQQRQWLMLGLEDHAAVATEVFSQWIVEDSFCAPRPAWEQAGVRYVDDIKPYENIKLGLLNAAHSAIAYAGLLTGLETVDAVVEDPKLATFLHRLMNEDLMPALLVPPEFNLPAYRDQLLQRFANPHLAHRCQQIAMDGSEKIPQRWLQVLQTNAVPKQLLKALACWCFYILYSEHEIQDPKASRFYELRGDTSDAALEALLACARITRESVADFDSLQAQLRQNLDAIAAGSARALLTG